MIAGAARFLEPLPYPDYLGWTPAPGCRLEGVGSCIQSIERGSGAAARLLEGKPRPS